MTGRRQGQGHGQPRTGKKSTAAASRSMSVDVVKKDTPKIPNRRQSLATAAASHSMYELAGDEMMDRDENCGRRCHTSMSMRSRSRGEGLSRSTSTSSFVVGVAGSTPIREQQRFFPILSVASPKDSLFNFSFPTRKARSSKKSGGRRSAEVKLEIKEESVDVVELEIQDDDADRVLSSPNQAPLPGVSPVSRPGPLQQISNGATATTHHNNDSDTTEELAEGGEIQLEGDIRFRIDDDESEFLKLANSEVTGNEITLHTSQIERCASYMELNDGLTFRESDSGVGIASFDQVENTTTGYLRIAPRTLKPMSIISRNVTIALWVLQGEIVLRSTEYKTVDGNNTLDCKKLGAGSCILVPPMTPYMLENWSYHHPVVIGYTMISSE